MTVSCSVAISRTKLVLVLPPERLPRRRSRSRASGSPPPRRDRLLAASSSAIQVEHRLHLGREPGQHPDVLDHEAGRAAVRVRERPAAGRELRPARRVVGVLREARAQVGGEVGHLGLLDAERGRERLARDVVRRPAEAAGDDEVVDAVALAADELGDRSTSSGTEAVRTMRTPSDSRRWASHTAFVLWTSPQTTSLPIVRIAASTRSSMAMSYPRRAGHISPADVSAAKPVRTRRCPATAMPSRPPRRTSQVACLRRTNVSPRRKGGSR